MSDPTIPELRDRAYSQYVRRVTDLNSANGIISSTIPIITPDELDKTNVSIPYVQSWIDKSISYQKEISDKTAYLQSIAEKHQECLDAYNKL